MNLTTKAIEGLERYQGITNVPDFLIDGLTASVKFAVPNSKLLDINVTLDMVKYIKMPYDLMAFEYEIEDAREDSPLLENDSIETFKASKRIALVCKYKILPAKLLVRDFKFIEDDALVVTSIYYEDAMKIWHFAPGMAIFEPAEVSLLDINSETYSFDATYLPYFEFIDSPYVLNRQKQNAGVLLRMVANDTADELALVIKTLVAMNAKNVKIVTIPPSEALNKKRIKHKKVPFFEYLTLDIFLSSEQIRKVRLNPSNLLDSIKHFTLKRLHSVRGHFKVRKTGIFFWNSFIRGSKTKGEIVKDYNIKVEK